jgi:glycerol-3-phosphate acyltransferase PlsY
MVVSILLFISYLLGSIPTGFIILFLIAKKDIRDFGSGNIGATNVFRLLGTRAALITLCLDMLKGYFAVQLSLYLGYLLTLPRFVSLLVAVSVILGHAFSCFLHFKGGKSVATAFGVLLAFNIELFFIALCLFLLILFLSSTVSFSSLSSLWITTLVSIFIGSSSVSLLLSIIVSFITIRHLQNIKRLLNGNENIIPFGILYSKKMKR